MKDTLMDGGEGFFFIFLVNDNVGAHFWSSQATRFYIDGVLDKWLENGIDNTCFFIDAFSYNCDKRQIVFDFYTFNTALIKLFNTLIGFL